MSMTETYPQLVDALHDLRRQWRLYKILEGGLLAFAGAVAGLLVIIAADNLLQPGSAVRVALAVSLWSALGIAILTLVVGRILEDRRDDFFAALVERKYPELRNQLINALQLGRGSCNGFSPRL